MFIKDNGLIIDKVKELCTTVLEQDAYHELTQLIDDFKNDDLANEHYQRFLPIKLAKEEKEAQGLTLTKEEQDQFEKEELALYANPVIRKYLFAQKEFENLQLILNDYLAKTIDLGRLPEPKQLKKITRGCGSHNR